MATILPPLNSDEASRAMIDGLTGRIRDELRKKILERIEPDLESAIDAAMEAFKLTVATWREPINLRETIKVLIERKP
jgi:hypothetical protein